MVQTHWSGHRASGALYTSHLILVAAIVAVFLLLLMLFVRVLASIIGSSLSTGKKVIWTLFAFWMPVATWLAWYLVGNPGGRRRHPATGY